MAEIKVTVTDTQVKCLEYALHIQFKIGVIMQFTIVLVLHKKKLSQNLLNIVMQILL